MYCAPGHRLQPVPLLPTPLLPHQAANKQLLPRPLPPQLPVQLLPVLPPAVLPEVPHSYRPDPPTPSSQVVNTQHTYYTRENTVPMEFSMLGKSFIFSVFNIKTNSIRVTRKDTQGVKHLYDHNMHHHVVRTFSSRALAESFYQEFCASGIPELLAEQEPSSDECFIIVEGVKPMACDNRKTLIMDALQFRGGVAYRFIGDLGGAWAQFSQFKEDGLVRQTHAPRTTF